MSIEIKIKICMSLSSGAKADDSDEEEDDKAGEEEGKEEAEGPATKNPGLIPLPDDSTVMQLSCGTFHTGKQVM